MDDSPTEITDDVRSLLQVLLKTDSDEAQYLCLRIGICNAFFPITFSKAFVHLPQFDANDGEQTKTVLLRYLLEDSFGIIERTVCQDKVDHIELSVDQQLAFECLTKFIRDYHYHQTCMLSVREDETATKTDVCAVLAIHIFANLVPANEVIVSSSLKRHSDNCECPCPCSGTVRLGNTGIGNKHVWHGHPDIVAKHCVISVRSREEKNDIKDECSPSKYRKLDEDNHNQTFMKRKLDLLDYEFSEQVIAQTITNSFAQNRELYKSNCLIPCFGCTMDELIVYAYDPDTDVLLRRKQQLLLFSSSNELMLHNLVELWFILNMHAFGSTFSEAFASKFDKSGFREFIHEYKCVHHYENCQVKAANGELRGCLPQTSTLEMEQKHLMCGI